MLTFILHILVQWKHSENLIVGQRFPRNCHYQGCGRGIPAPHPQSLSLAAAAAEVGPWSAGPAAPELLTGYLL